VPRRILIDLGLGLDRVFGQKGKAFLRERISGFNHDARFRPWIVVVDLDRDAECPAALVADWLPQPAHLMCFRVAVRELESWLLADPEALAGFLGIRRILIPASGRSRGARPRRAVSALLPTPASEARTGQALAIVRDHWRPAAAESNSDSLRRCRRRLLELGRKVS
jgi:hypothetical protein